MGFMQGEEKKEGSSPYYMRMGFDKGEKLILGEEKHMGKKIAKYFEHTWQLWVMLLPAMIYIFIFCYVPMYGVQLAFREYSFAKGLYRKLY